MIMLSNLMIKRMHLRFWWSVPLFLRFCIYMKLLFLLMVSIYHIIRINAILKSEKNNKNINITENNNEK